MSNDNDQFMRQAGLVNRRKLRDSKITMVGAGGIGSVAAMYLIKMGVQNLTVYDHDMVEIHNIPSQMYPKSSVGKPKVEALRDYLQYMEEVEINAINRRFTEEDRGEGIFIMAVDSMKARKEIWRAVKLSPKVMFLVDGRMGGWDCTRIAVNMLDDKSIEMYESTLFDDDESLPLPCTERAIIFNTGAIGSMIAASVAKHIQDYKIAPYVAYDIRYSRMVELKHG